MAIEIATAISTTIFDHSVGAVVQHFKYLWNHKKNLANLKKQVEKLDGVRDDKGYCVLVAERNAERIRRQVGDWQIDADKISVEARNIVEEYEEKSKKRCLIGLCPNLVLHYQLSRKACKKQIEIVEAMTEANKFNGVADRAVRRVISTLSIEGYFTFDSRKLTLEEIMKTLQDPTKNSIGVYGFGGMGKTTLVKQVASQAAEEKMFEEIVVAHVTQTPKLKEIQGQIADKLDLKLEESSVAERAGHIHKRLKEKKILVILDDLWEVLDLEKVGIPFGVHNMGCKIILTSRLRDVLTSMGTQKYFNVEALEEKEAWKLFEEKTISVVKDPSFLSIGKEIAKRCKGLPVLIVTIAASLSSRPNLHAWKDALNQLKTMNNNEMHEIVNSSMEFISYKHLKQTHKQLFLLCGLMGSFVRINDVLKYSLGWDLFDEDSVTVEEARNKLHALILDLKASCLFLNSDYEGIVEMHDVVRGVAISIARKDLNMLSVGDNDADLNRWPGEDVLKRSTAMVIHHYGNYLPCLPEQLECPLLELFIANAYKLDPSLTIPNTFFERTRKLKVLGMSGMSVSTLPASLSFLENLQTLRLDYCYELEDISIVGELKKLQVLSFVSSNIGELPVGVGQLFELRILDLSHCLKLKVIPAGLLAGLSHLEELYMSRSFNRWDAEEGARSNASLAELKDLPDLRCLEIEVPDAKLLPEDLNFEKLERYAIHVGDMSVAGEDIGLWLEDSAMRFSKKEISRDIFLHLGTTSINHLQHGVNRLLRRTEHLCLRRLKGVNNVVHELDRDGFLDLKHLHIQIDYEIQFIVNLEHKQHRVFPALESLHLSKMLKLEKICNGRMLKDSFCKLTTLNVKNCDKLESLFSFSMAITLPHLQEIHVSSCNILGEIVSKKSGEDDVNTNGVVSEKIEFSQLRILTLLYLPRLVNFYSSAKMLPIIKERQKLLTTDVQSEEIIPDGEETSSLPFFEEVSLPRLEELRLIGISNLTEIWDDKLPETSYRNLKRLTVNNCPHLVNVISSKLVLQLCRSLEVLHVKRCQSLEEVFVVPDKFDIDEEHDRLVSPLIRLSLRDLPQLRCIWSKYHPWVLSFKNLQKLSVKDCYSLEYLFTSSITMSLVQLKKLEITSCRMMKQIIAKGKGETTTDTIIFPQLSYLHLEDLRKLRRFCWGNCIAFPSLKDLRIQSCQKMETFCDQFAGNDVTMSKGLQENESDGLQPLFNEKANFPSLEILIIDYSNNIKSIWHRQLREEGSFCKLEEVTVRKCDDLWKIFPSTMVTRIQSLKRLEIEDCGALEEVFEVRKELSLKNVEPVLQLSKLYLKNLPKLRCIWKRDPHEALSFQNLCEVNVGKCERLKHVFPASVAQSLHQLEELRIEDCRRVKTIVDDENKELAEDEIKQVPTTFMFPKLNRLHLKTLSKLECFYPRKHTIEWPVLQELDVHYCHEVSDLDFLYFSERSVRNQCLKLLSKLECLVIKGKNVVKMKIIMQDGLLFPELFRNVKRLEIIDCHDESTAFPFSLLACFHNAEVLVVNNSWFEEDSPHEGEGLVVANEIKESNNTDQTVLFPQLKQLQFYHLYGLKYIDKEGLEFIEELISLTVGECHHLTNLVMGSVSFKFLTFLNVHRCAGLINLLQPSTARSLEQLKYLTIRECQMIEEIVAGDGDHDSQDEIIFSRLESLHLVELWTLTNFCTGNYTFKFPSLKKVNVENCPNMRTFCGGIACTPELYIYYENGIDKCEKDWTDDLNTTMQNFSGMLPSNLEEVTIRSKDMKMIMSQYHHFFDPIMLEITEFPDGSVAFPSELLTRFSSLNGLRVRDCLFKEIFPCEVEVRHLAHLTNLELHNLPELKYIWTDDSPLIPVLEKLVTLVVSGCSRLSNLVPQCSVSLNFLMYLTVVDCDGLKNLIHSSTARSLKQLRELCVIGCQMIEEIVAGDGYDSEGEIIFSRLESLELGNLPRLTNFCNGNYAFNFPTLSVVIVRQCPNVRNFCGGNASTPKLETVYLTDSKNEECWAGDLNTTIELVFSDMEVQRETTITPSTLLTNHFEAEAQIREKPNENAGKEIEEICGELNEAGNEDEIFENGINSEKEIEVCEMAFEPNEGVENFEKWNEPRKGTEVCKEGNKVDICGKDRNTGKVVDTCEKGRGKEPEICDEKVMEPSGKEGETSIHPCLQSNISEKSHLYSQGHAYTSFRTFPPFGQENENSPETTPQHSDPTSLSPAEEQTIVGPNPPQDVSSSSQVIPTSTHPVTSFSLGTTAGTSAAASHSQPKDFQGSLVTKKFIPLFSKVLQILQTQPRKSLNAEEVQFMEGAYRDLSDMNFPVEWLCPYLEDARKCLLVGERTKAVELKIVEIEAQLQALKEKKKALEEESVDLDKPLYDD